MPEGVRQRKVVAVARMRATPVVVPLGQFQQRLKVVAEQAQRKFVEDLDRIISISLAPPVDMDLPTWADTYRMLSRASGSMGGRWETSTVEVARGPMKAVTEEGVQIITCMVATQLLKTSLLENTIGRFSHLDPCPMLLVQPKDEAVDQFSKERLVPMIQATPIMSELMGDMRTRKSDDTMRFKRFPGGFLAIASAGSPTNLAMRAIRITLLDEIDKYEPTKEGDPVMLAEERTSTFPTNRLCIRVCSPTWVETSRIYASYMASDQRRAFVPCPHCGHFQDLDFFRHVQWQRDGQAHVPSTAMICCEMCGKGWTERQRLDALAGIQWRQCRPFVCCGDQQDPRIERNWLWDKTNQVGWACCHTCGEAKVSNHHVGFTASKLYSPFLTMGQLAEKWLEAEKDPESKQTFMNTQLGMPFKADALKEVVPQQLMKRREDWGDKVPNEVLVLTAGVDIQPGTSDTHGRIECEVVGWGLGEESWSLAYEVFTGDPAQQEIWDELDDYLLTPHTRLDGRPHGIQAVCVDTGGHNTQEAYAFARARVGRNVWGIKGANDQSQWSPIWPEKSQTKKDQKYRTGYKPIIIGVSAGKEALRQRLLIEEPGPGFCHFPTERSPAYFEQLTSERLLIERRNGSPTRRWVLPSHRHNEALDVRVYAYAALWGLYHVRKLRLERQAELLKAAMPVPAPVRQLVQANVATPPVAPRRRSAHRGNWMS